MTDPETTPAVDGMATSWEASRSDTILDSIADGVFTVDENWRITSFNRAAELITGVTRADAIGQGCSDVFRTSICESACALRRALSTGKPVTNQTVYIVDAKGNRVPISISAAALRDQHGRVVGGVETFRDLTQLEELRKRLSDKYTFEDIIGRSPAMQRLFEILPVIAESNSTVLIEGPSGTGKELLARAIHNLSSRRKRRFLAVNCGALPDGLLESELFGYKAGAFTDARRDKPGRFTLADGGTIFLDEIGDVSPAMQVRLLRVLQEMTFEPLGSGKPVKVDVRVVTASNRVLKQLVEQGKFREDLYYRVNVMRLELPRLRDRREDVPLLIDHLVEKQNRLRGGAIPGISEEALGMLLSYDYPGNIRELENIVEHASVLCRGGVIRPEHLPTGLSTDAGPRSLSQSALSLKEAERMLIVDALRRQEGNRLAAAQELGIAPSTLFRKVKTLRIPLPEKDGRQNIGAKNPTALGESSANRDGAP